MRVIRRLWLTLHQLSAVVLFAVITLFFELACLVAGLMDGQGNAAHRCLRYWAKASLRFAGLRVQIVGLDKLDPLETYVFMPNHESFLDILLALTFIPHNFRFVILSKLFFNPLLYLPLKASRQIPIKQDSPRGSLDSIRSAIRLLRNNISIVVFPEGSRTRTGRLQDFKRMPFILPLRTGIPVVPVLISGAFAALKRGHVLVNPVTLKLCFLDPITPTNRHWDRTVYAEKVRQELAEAAARMS